MDEIIKFKIIPIFGLIVSIIMWIFFWITLFNSSLRPVAIEKNLFSGVVIILLYSTWFISGPIFIVLNSWRLEIIGNKIIYYKYFGLKKEGYNITNISNINLMKATKKKATPEIIIMFENGKKLKIQYGAIGFKKMWEYLGGKNEMWRC